MQGWNRGFGTRLANKSYGPTRASALQLIGTMGRVDCMVPRTVTHLLPQASSSSRFESYIGRLATIRRFSDDVDSAKDNKTVVKKKGERFFLGKYPLEEIEDLRQDVKMMLEEAKKDRHGRYRGVNAINTLLEKVRLGMVRWPHEWPLLPTPRKYSKQIITVELNRLLFRRHALRHGAKDLDELDESQLAQTIYGIGTDKILHHRKAKAALKEAWRYGKSPSLEFMFKGEEYDLEDKQPEKVDDDHDEEDSGIL